MRNDVKGDKYKKSVSIVMMSTFSGASFKAPQLKNFIHYLSSNDLLAKSFGIPDGEDNNEFSDYELMHLKRSRLMKLFMKLVNKLLLLIGSKNGYIYREKIYGFFAIHFFKADGDIVLLKPRPLVLVEHYKKQGKTVVVEASEAHTEFTFQQLKNECELLSIPLVKNNYTNPKAIEDFATGVMQADRLICLSDYSAQTYIERGFEENKIKVTGLTTGLMPVKPREANGSDIVFVSVANHSVLKGTLHLLRIWKKYKVPNKLMIVGHIHTDLQPYLSDYEDIENVVFTGSIRRTDIELIYTKNRCVGVLLSVSEGFSRAILECLSTATPVLVTKCCTCDVVENGKNGFVVAYSDEAEVYQRILEFTNMSPERYAEMAKFAYNDAVRVENDFIEKYVGALLCE